MYVGFLSHLVYCKTNNGKCFSFSLNFLNGCKNEFQYIQFPLKNSLLEFRKKYKQIGMLVF